MNTIYRRHDVHCEHRADRNHLGCECPLWITGPSLTRRTLGTRDLVVAQQRAATFVTAPPTPDRGETLSRSIIKFRERRESISADKTHVQRKQVLERLLAYCAGRGVTYTCDLTVALLEDFKHDGLRGIADTSRRTYMAVVLAFLRYAYRVAWIEQPLGDRLERCVAEPTEVEPFDPDEIVRLRAGIGDPIGCLLFELLLQTGLRISDAIKFDPASLRAGQHGLWIYPFRMTKAKRVAKRQRFDIYVTPALRDAIEAAKPYWLSPALPFHGTGTQRADYCAVRYSMKRLGERVDVADCNPHRLRHTFAVFKLQGVDTVTLGPVPALSLDDVSRLLCHASVSQTERVYGNWTTGRATRLESVMAASVSVSLPKLLGNGGGNS